MTSLLHYETQDGQNVQKAISFKVPTEKVENNYGTSDGLFYELFNGMKFESGFFAVTAVPFINYDPSKINQEYYKFLKARNPYGAFALEFWNNIYLDEMKDPSFRQKQEILLRLYHGDETALDEIGKFLFAPKIVAISATPLP